MHALFPLPHPPRLNHSCSFFKFGCRHHFSGRLSVGDAVLHHTASLSGPKYSFPNYLEQEHQLFSGYAPPWGSPWTVTGQCEAKRPSSLAYFWTTLAFLAPVGSAAVSYTMLSGQTSPSDSPASSFLTDVVPKSTPLETCPTKISSSESVYGNLTRDDS